MRLTLKTTLAACLIAFGLWQVASAVDPDHDSTGLTDSLPVLPQAPVMASGKHAQGVAKRLERRDPSQDDWDTERLSGSVAVQLKQLGRLAESRSATADKLSGLVADNVRCSSLRPAKRQPAFQDGSILVSRAEQESVEDTDDQDDAAGTEHLASELESLLAAYPPDSHCHLKFKVVHIQSGNSDASNESDQSTDSPEKTFHTEVIFLAWNDESPSIQQNAKWNCTWTLPDTSTGSTAKPLLQEIQVAGYEEVVGEQGSVFADCTLAVLGNEAAFQDHLSHGTGYWMRRLQATLGLDTLGHCGIAIADVNGDEREDLFVCQPGGLPNRLFIQNEDGTAQDVAAAAGVDFLDRTISALLIDIDNDGDQDLAMLTPLDLLLLENDGSGKFKRRSDSQIAATNIFSLSSVDYDNDGDLDLYVCGYSFPTGKAQVPTPYHDANNGYKNRLLRNEGEWKFVEVTDQVGLSQNNLRYSFASAWEDYDNDGDQDLYVANDFGRNNLYRNDDGKFVDVAAESGVEDLSAGMSVSWGDFNQDGWADIYVSNMFSSAGNRVTYQRKFRDDTAADVKAIYQRHARGNSLFQNMGDGTFQDVSDASNVTMGRWAWGSRFVDLNNDGRQDLIVANGNMTGPDTDDL